MDLSLKKRIGRTNRHLNRQFLPKTNLSLKMSTPPLKILAKEIKKT